MKTYKEFITETKENVDYERRLDLKQKLIKQQDIREIGKIIFPEWLKFKEKHKDKFEANPFGSNKLPKELKIFYKVKAILQFTHDKELIKIQKKIIDDILFKRMAIIKRPILSVIFRSYENMDDAEKERAEKEVEHYVKESSINFILKNEGLEPKNIEDFEKQISLYAEMKKRKGREEYPHLSKDEFEVFHQKKMQQYYKNKRLSTIEDDYKERLAERQRKKEK